MPRLYTYVGPAEIADTADMTVRRQRITCASDVQEWARESDVDADGQFTATFVVDAAGQLWIADRHAEHVACARGKPVLSAGEITFLPGPVSAEAVFISNQSTGYCPEPSSWPHVHASLASAGIGHSADFDVACIFRRCECGQINIVKNHVYSCVVCSADLPLQWNCCSPDSGSQPESTDCR